jgi:hypothetical protein
MNDAVCQKCGEWATVIQYGMRTCLKCGHVTPVKWSTVPTKEAGATYRDDV